MYVEGLNGHYYTILERSDREKSDNRDQKPLRRIQLQLQVKNLRNPLKNRRKLSKPPNSTKKNAKLFWHHSHYFSYTILSAFIQFLELIKHHVSKSIRNHYMAKTLKYGTTGNPVVQIWQPCRSYIILNVSIQFLELKAMCLARKIVFLTPLEPNIC